jgi:hypothetical protein
MLLRGAEEPSDVLCRAAVKHQRIWPPPAWGSYLVAATAALRLCAGKPASRGIKISMRMNSAALPRDVHDARLVPIHQRLHRIRGNLEFNHQMSLPPANTHALTRSYLSVVLSIAVNICYLTLVTAYIAVFSAKGCGPDERRTSRRDACSETIDALHLEGGQRV